VEAAQVHLLFSRLQAACPKPTTELRYLSPFELLVAVILSAQSTDKKVNEATARLFPLANTVLNVAFGEPTIAVDTHIFRVANRTGLAPGKTVRAVEEGLLAATPEEFRHDAHHWLILHGRYVCTARKPRCWACPIRDLCAYPDKSEVN